MKERFGFFLVGLFFLTLGVSVIIKANVGASPWDALAVGQANMFGITIGTSVFINGIILIIINAILLKKKPEILAGVTIFVIGMIMDIWLVHVLDTFNPTTLLAQYTALFVGIFLYGLGIAIYLQANFPAGPMDSVMVAVSTRFNLSLRTARFITDGSALLLAVAFKGAIGLGTIIVTILLALVVQMLHPVFARLMKRLTVA
ncbi:YczE/YyaS/YitT family protein [Priestia taiwanensis]|uniref:Membrane protein n=1 Tax=Priestia taiwanensis TaxID=1347902 RepID=A0A917AQD0_9BACI|nr:YitT family protein [Priestia taiwanensis]MBM7362985.1 putative membrane protein YczE [Priestia taiwanensis]GGE66705.1 membrane protein [Priestia taiwanensis]